MFRAILTVLVLWWVGLLPGVAPCLEAESAAPRQADWTAYDGMHLYFEAVAELRKRMLQPQTLRHTVQQTLKSYVRSLDPFSDYLTTEEYKEYRLAQQPHYAGVGMELWRNVAGQIVCTPYPESPAARAGIKAGDVLIAVDGNAVTGQPLLRVATQIRGAPNTSVHLTMRASSGGVRRLTLRRVPLHVKSVTVKPYEGITVIRLVAFVESTPAELRRALAPLPATRPVVIDLRGNGGGGFHQAVEAARLFLEPGRTIVRLVKPDEHTQAFKSVPPPLDTTRPLYLWHNADTASAAEVFIAALVQNGRAYSIGQKTFGKGTMQEIVELSDGSALFMTTAVLQTPTGGTYHNNGIEPTHKVFLENITDKELVSITTNLFKESYEINIGSSKYTDLNIDIRFMNHDDSSYVYLNCFDEKISDKEEALFFASEVRFAFHETYDYYLMKVGQGSTGFFVPCVGGWTDESKARHRQRVMSAAMDTTLFVHPVDRALLLTLVTASGQEAGGLAAVKSAGDGSPVGTADQALVSFRLAWPRSRVETVPRQLTATEYATQRVYEQLSPWTKQALETLQSLQGLEPAGLPTLQTLTALLEQRCEQRCTLTLVVTPTAATAVSGPQVRMVLTGTRFFPLIDRVLQQLDGLAAGQQPDCAALRGASCATSLQDETLPLEGEARRADRVFAALSAMCRDSCAFRLALRPVEEMPVVAADRASTYALEQIYPEALTLQQPVQPGVPALAVERIECSPAAGDWLLLYAGNVVDVDDGAVALRLDERLGYRHNPSRQGVDRTDWFCAPKRKHCYAPVAFNAWGGTSTKHQLRTFRSDQVYHARVGVVNVGATLVQKVCQR